MRLFSLFFAISALFVGSPGDAKADTYNITYEGVISNSFDRSGIFGQPQGSLDGQTYVATYILTFPLDGTQVNNGADFRSVLGYGESSPLSATITINGITRSIGSFGGENQDNYNSTYGEATQSYAPTGFNGVGHNAYKLFEINNRRGGDGMLNYIYSDVNQIVNSTNFTDELVYFLQRGDDSFGTFGFDDIDLIAGDFILQTYGDLTPQSVTITRTSAVPELSTWLCFVVAFGILGAILRNRRTKRVIGFQI